MNIRHATALAFALVLQLSGCGGGGGIGGTGITQGTMRVSITDAPACGYDHVYITVDKVRVHQSANAGDNDAGWSDIVLAPPQRIDLLGLTNGVMEELGQTALPAGKYTQMRLVLATNGSGTPPANSVVLTGGGEKALDTPSAQQSGIKLNADIDVPAGKEVDVLLDFDACKSIVKAGNSGKYLLKPVIAVTTLLSDAGLRVSGNVDPAIVGPATSVSVQSDSAVVVKATTPAADGSFLLRPVPAGNYNLVVTSAGHVTAVMTGVPVVAAAPTVVSSASAPIAPAAAASAAASVTGVVTPVPVTATVRALQTLTGGPTVEVAFTPVDVDLGTFSFLLPVSAPQRTAYALNPVVITLTSDAAPAVAGKYTLEATSAGTTKPPLPVDVNVQPVPPVTFTFP